MLSKIISDIKPFLDVPETRIYLNLVAIEFFGKGEKHHILPKSLFPEYRNSKWNIVNLSFEQHYIAHSLLVNMFEGAQKLAMSRAWNQINGRSSGIFITPERYSELKKLFSDNNPFCKIDKLRYAKISAAKKGKPNGTKGIKKPKDFAEKYLKGGNNPMAKAVICDGIRFPTITEAGKHFGYTKQAVMYWLKKGRFYYEGDEPKEYIPTDSRTSGILVNGVKFDTMNSAALHLDVTTATLRNWIKSGKATKLPKES